MANDIGELVPEKNKARKGSRRVDDDDDDVLDIDAGRVPVAAPGVWRVTLDGVPDPESYAPLVEARAKHAAVVAELDKADAVVSALSSKLGVPANASRGRIEALTIELLSDGKDTSDIAALDAAANRARLLRAAAEKSAARIKPILEQAVRNATNAAHDLVFAPAERKVAEALLPFLSAVREYQIVIEKLAANRLGSAVRRAMPPIVELEVLGGQNHAVSSMVRAGYLTREEAREALPELAGI